MQPPFEKISLVVEWIALPYLVCIFGHNLPGMPEDLELLREPKEAHTSFVL